MVTDGLISAADTAQMLGITMNNLRQIQHRKTITWVEKSGRNVYYRKADVENYVAKRQGRVSE
jgi:phage antirepressor YoqD-like protein